MSKKGGTKTTKVSKKNSGLSKSRRANKELRKVRSKLRRWTRYNKEMHLGHAWDTSGLEKRAKQLESIISQGSTTVV